VTGCINTETIDTHLDEIAIAVDKIFSHCIILSIEVHTVTCNLSPPAVWLIPVEVTEMVPVVVWIMILTIGILHQGKTPLILCRRQKTWIVTT
jgi:hypothetical protein